MIFNLRHPLIKFTLLIFVLRVLYRYALIAQEYFHPIPKWSSKTSGFLDRSIPYPEPHSYNFTTSTLELAVLYHAMAAPHTFFTLAVFGDHVAIDSTGSMYTLLEQDYNEIIRLRDSSASITTKAGSFSSFWMTRTIVSDQPTEIMYSPHRPGEHQLGKDHIDNQYISTGVHAFSKWEKRLDTRTSGYKEVPDEVWELTGLVREAMRRSLSWDETDQVILGRVRSVLWDGLWFALNYKDGY